jgi:hypothetical protein
MDTSKHSHYSHHSHFWLSTPSRAEISHFVESAKSRKIASLRLRKAKVTIVTIVTMPWGQGLNPRGVWGPVRGPSRVIPGKGR